MYSDIHVYIIYMYSDIISYYVIPVVYLNDQYSRIRTTKAARIRDGSSVSVLTNELPLRLVGISTGLLSHGLGISFSFRVPWKPPSQSKRVAARNALPRRSSFPDPSWSFTTKTRRSPAEMQHMEALGDHNSQNKMPASDPKHQIML